MIAHIEGNVIHVAEKFIIINTKNGVGYKVFLTPECINACSLNLPVSFWIYTAVRESSLDLYGFSSIDDMSFFELLLDISGIGPKSALGIISITTVESLSEAIATNNTTYLTKVSGIGKKTAERIVIELRDKVKRKENYTDGNLRDESDALEALKSLGYSDREARESLKKVETKKDTSSRVKAALKILGEK